ncbi:hypothetical protein H5410_051853 [Solanum commersonii]|uniref:Uncharacterized protein n=1 Tax=Solanum commersonii TaxID=4109 RepID=A0A9J5WZP1_SOLCO|nr:hypothetical protein H5410_051853 [Solanum commersonii]
MESVGSHGQTCPLSSSNKPKSSNGASWSRQANRPIFKLKRAPKKVNPILPILMCSPWIFSDPEFWIFFAKSFHGRTLIP